MKNVFSTFWSWYNKHLFLNTTVAAVLFTLQLIHLYWLSAHVVSLKLWGVSFFDLSGIWEILILLVDYTEIPAIITTSLIYINDIRKGRTFHGLLYLFFINSQWLHLFWITDEFVLETFFGGSIIGFSGILAWVAIGIDYLELPVIYDTLRRLPKLLQSSLHTLHSRETGTK